MEAGAGVALVEEDVTLAGVDFAGATGNTGYFFRRQTVEERNVGEQCFYVDRVISVHGLWPELGRPIFA